MSISSFLRNLHTVLHSGCNDPLQGRQGSRVCITDSPGELGLAHLAWCPQPLSVEPCTALGTLWPGSELCREATGAGHGHTQRQRHSGRLPGFGAGEKREITNSNKTHSILQSGETGGGKQLTMIKTEYNCHIKKFNPIDRGAWQATVHEVAESDTTEVT